VDTNSKIYVAGHGGMVGSAIVRKLEKLKYCNIIFRDSRSLNLINQNEVFDFFEKEKPDYVFLAAAKVGGIYANNIYRGQFIYENLAIQNNIIHAAHKIKTNKLLSLGSACIYPRNAPPPIKEEELLTGTLEPTNEPYAIAKIAGIKLCENYYHQYGDNFISVMPNNLYGPNDNFDLENSHVIPALIRKFHEAKQKDDNLVEVWGTGSPLREFLHVDDLADACVYLMKTLDAKNLFEENISHINIGSGDEVSINKLALMIKELVGYKGELIFNSKFPDGTPRKLVDISRLNALGWKSRITLQDGLKNVYNWYEENIK